MIHQPAEQGRELFRREGDQTRRVAARKIFNAFQQCLVFR
jgi:hypothetical protein